MAVLDPKKTIKNLQKKGFTEPLNKSTDHIRLEFWHNGKLTRANTKLSHNNQDLNDFLISKMSKQVCLTKNQFIDLAECPLGQKEYEAILKEQGFI
jgi:hypothetical protein